MAEQEVKLYTYVHNCEEIIVEGHRAKDWGEFLIIFIDGSEITPDRYDQLEDMFSQITEKMDKKVIIFPGEWDVEFYGVKEIEDLVSEENED